MHRHCICTVLLPWHPDLACFGLSTRGQCDSRTTEVKSVFCCQHNHVWNPEIPKVWSEADWKEELEGFPAAVRRVRWMSASTWRGRPERQWVLLQCSSAGGWETEREWTLSLSLSYSRLHHRCSERNSSEAAPQKHSYTLHCILRKTVCHKYSMLFCGHRFW